MGVQIKEIAKKIEKVRLENINMAFPSPNESGKTIKALENINLSLYEGEIVCMLGSSGCGKSTILNIIAGFLKPSFGDIYLNGIKKDLKPGSDRGVVFQTPALFPWLSVLNNVLFGHKHNGGLTEEIKSHALEIVESVGLKGFENHFPYQLSGGMKQRTAIARALIMKPDILLMDEPFGALDSNTRLSMQEQLLELSAQYKPTILFITHDIEEAIFLADRVQIMTPRPGKIYKEYVIDIPKPRSYEDITSSEFTKLKSELLSLMHSYS